MSACQATYVATSYAVRGATTRALDNDTLGAAVFAAAIPGVRYVATRCAAAVALQGVFQTERETQS